jgi:hypothetical protein
MPATRRATKNRMRARTVARAKKTPAKMRATIARTRVMRTPRLAGMHARTPVRGNGTPGTTPRTGGAMDAKVREKADGTLARRERIRWRPSVTTSIERSWRTAADHRALLEKLRDRSEPLDRFVG